MTKTLWEPSADRIQAARITAFRDWVNERHRLNLKDYDDLHRWSIAASESFWSAVWEFCSLIGSRPDEVVLSGGSDFATARWFPSAKLNFAENLLRHRSDQVALVSVLEDGSRRSMSYAELYTKVAQLAGSLRAEGVGIGDRVAGVMPNLMETVIAMLATTSIGAIWSSCSPDFGLKGMLDRFGQIEPKVLFGADGYFYNSKRFDSLERLAAVARDIPSVERVVVVPVVAEPTDLTGIRNAVHFETYLNNSHTEIQFPQLPFTHPVYIMYSSGTTGKPKCIVHGAGGTLLQHQKEHRLHVDLGRDDVFFYFTTCGWMMWNWLISGLATGATLILYDGSPFADDGNILLDLIDRERVSIFGASAKYFSALEKSGKKPAETHRLSHLKSILSTGSPLAPSSFEYVYSHVKKDICLSSISGGTDILSCFVGGCPTRPVYPGEIQVKGLGMAVEIWNESGRSVTGEKGELVCTKPFPSTPVRFWNDHDGTKYREAYFERWPNVWAHGDYGEITDSGGMIIHGRSDAVLNPGGVRIGTAEIYRQVESLEEIDESIVIGQEWNDDERVVLFVVLCDNVTLNGQLEEKIRTTIRHNATPRHVPAKIIAVSDIPRTTSGKIVELAVRDVVHGRPVKNKEALANPGALELYRDLPALRD